MLMIKLKVMLMVYMFKLIRLSLLDGSGNIFDLVEPASQCDKNGKATFYKYANLAIGPEAIKRRCTLDGSTYGNVAFGPAALSGINGGDYNTVMGFSSAKNDNNGK